MTITERKTRLASIMSEMTGHPVDLTIRGKKSFTFSTEEVQFSLGDVVSKYFGNLASVTVVHDVECGSFAYVEAV